MLTTEALQGKAPARSQAIIIIIISQLQISAIQLLILLHTTTADQLNSFSVCSICNATRNSFFNGGGQSGGHQWLLIPIWCQYNSYQLLLTLKCFWVDFWLKHKKNLVTSYHPSVPWVISRTLQRYNATISLIPWLYWDLANVYTSAVLEANPLYITLQYKC